MKEKKMTNRTPIEQARSCFMPLVADNEEDLRELIETHVALGYSPQGGFTISNEGKYVQGVYRDPEIIWDETPPENE